MKPIFFLSIILTVLTACSGGGSGGSGAGAATTTTAVGASDLPLLVPTRALGVIYSTVDPTAKATLDQSFGEVITAGANSYELSVTWASLESAPGIVDLSSLDNLLTIIQNAGQIPYLVIKTVDTVSLEIPLDLRDANDSNQLAAGRAFDDPVIINRFKAVLDALVPLLVQRGGFFLSVGNEIDINFSAVPSRKTPFLNFLIAVRNHCQQLDSRLAIGATLTYDSLNSDPSYFDSIRDNSDAMAINYYPLTNGMVRSPGLVASELGAVVQRAGTKPVLLQEAGYPTGALNGSSEAMQKTFVENLYDYVSTEPRIRFLSSLHLADYTAADIQSFSIFYNSTDPQFVEFLSSLGMRNNDGSAKLSYPALLQGMTKAKTP
ncbi:MAG: hypothetical protein P1V97_01445 [Planctomycetota bacterium]|nr:hypothetical protein [Planctomycetota bacterium]